MIKYLTATALVASVLLPTAGCRSDPSLHADSVAAGWPEKLSDLSFVWTASDGIDLLNGPAVPVRAYVESFVLAKITGEKKYLYPGFENATDEAWRPGGAYDSDPVVGTFTQRLLSIDRVGTDVTVIGCAYSYSAASPHGNEYEAEAYPFGKPESGIAAFRVKLSAPTDSPDHEVPQVGPARTPADDVFAPYHITRYDGGYFRAETYSGPWKEKDATTSECVAQAPDSLDRRNYLTTNYLPRTDYPTLPTAPGWPASPQAQK